ncbi:MAG: glycosyltransferase family protein [Lachnospiraceae bacterium]
MTREEYIYRATALEENDMEAAFKTVQEGYRVYPNDYELIFMMANYYYLKSEKEYAYVYYLVAITLCDNEDAEIIKDNYKVIDPWMLNSEKVRNILYECIKERLEMGEYTKTYHCITEIIFTSDSFLFKEIIDQWLRYYYMLLEIVACEMNHGGIMLDIQKYIDWKKFEKLVLKFKFEIRKIWFGFTNDENKILDIIDEYGVSADFLAVVIKYSVEHKYVAAVMDKMATMINSAGNVAKAKNLELYADWYRKICEKNENLILFPRNKSKYPVHELVVGHNLHKSVNHINDKKIAYIMCANDDTYVSEAIEYLSYQNIPDEYMMEIYVVKNAQSMTQGYNLAMEQSDARYKIYIHQDTFIFDPDYTIELVKILESGAYQILGVAGAVHMPESGVWWDCSLQEMKMCLYQDMVINMFQSTTIPKEQKLVEVETLDGVLLATNTDIRWREDLFTHFHFYDISQTIEFRKRGLHAAVYNNISVGVLHEVSVNKKKSTKEAYEKACKIYKEEYCNEN